MTDNIDVRSSVDIESRKFLAAIQYFGGKATTSEIRRRSGLSRPKTTHRFNRLEDLGLIRVSKAASGKGNRTPPKIATLTGDARAEIERGLLYDIDRSKSEDEIYDLSAEVRTLAEDIESLQNRVDVLTDSLRGYESRIEALEDDQDFLIGEWADWVEACIFGIRECLKVEGVAVDEIIESELRDQ